MKSSSSWGARAGKNRAASDGIGCVRLTPILTHELATRLETALAEASAARLAGVATLEGNPLGIESRSFDHVIASRVGSSVGHYHYFSAPQGLRAGDAELVGPIVEWFGDAPLYVRLAPLLVDEVLLGALADAGLRQTAFMSTMYGVPRGEARTEVEVREDRRAFARLWTAERTEQELVVAEFSKGWRCYVADIDGRAVAYGALHIASNGVGVCAAAATLPQYRGRGCQTALLTRRIQEAGQSGCELMAIQASPGSGSQRNMQRLGLQLAWTGVTWTR
jgi:GNAT superfamily N-acetyltransferase